MKCQLAFRQAKIGKSIRGIQGIGSKLLVTPRTWGEGKESKNTGLILLLIVINVFNRKCESLRTVETHSMRWKYKVENGGPSHHRHGTWSCMGCTLPTVLDQITVSILSSLQVAARSKTISNCFSQWWFNAVITTLSISQASQDLGPERGYNSR